MQRVDGARHMANQKRLLKKGQSSTIAAMQAAMAVARRAAFQDCVRGGSVAVQACDLGSWSAFYAERAAQSAALRMRDGNDESFLSQGGKQLD